MLFLAALLAASGPPPLRLTKPRSRAYRTALRRAAAAPADFAGHWVLATIGCGAECLQIAAIDRRTGRVVWFPPTLCCWPDSVMEPLIYRRGSRVLVTRGLLDERGTRATRRWRFDGRRFRRVTAG